MNWFTCDLEKYIDKKKHSGLMGTWLRDKSFLPNTVYNFYYKQRMLPTENIKSTRKQLAEKIQEATWRNNLNLIDRQNFKEFLIWDYGCQFIHFRIYDYRNYTPAVYSGDYCRLVLISTDDKDWEIEFHSDLLHKVMKFIQNNFKYLTLGMIKDEFKPKNTEECK